jgi:hypothetical protein
MKSRGTPLGGRLQYRSIFNSLFVEIAANCCVAVMGRFTASATFNFCRNPLGAASARISAHFWRGALGARGCR